MLSRPWCTPWTPLVARTRRLTPSICSRTCSISWAGSSCARQASLRYAVASGITPACNINAWSRRGCRSRVAGSNVHRRRYPGLVELGALSSEGRRASPHTLEQGIQGVADPQPGRRAGRRSLVARVREVGKPVGTHRERASQRGQFTAPYGACPARRGGTARQQANAMAAGLNRRSSTRTASSRQEPVVRTTRLQAYGRRPSR